MLDTTPVVTEIIVTHPNGIAVHFVETGEIYLLDEQLNPVNPWGNDHRLVPGVPESPVAFWKSANALFAKYSDRIVRIGSDWEAEIAVDMPGFMDGASC